MDALGPTPSSRDVPGPRAYSFPCGFHSRDLFPLITWVLSSLTLPRVGLGSHHVQHDLVFIQEGLEDLAFFGKSSDFLDNVRDPSSPASPPCSIPALSKAPHENRTPASPPSLP